MQKLDKHFQGLTAAAFARYGFAYADLLARWDAVVGSELAGITEPVRIRWPRQQETERRKSGGTLVIRTRPGHGLAIQYQTPAIMERINAFYGYQAIVEIKVMQGPLAPRRAAPAVPRLAGAEARELDAELADIEDTGLRAALRRLGEVALAEARKPDEPR